MLLAGLYLFFFRVLWAITSDLRDPRIRTARKHARIANSATPTPPPLNYQPTPPGQSGTYPPPSSALPPSHSGAGIDSVRSANPAALVTPGGSTSPSIWAAPEVLNTTLVIIEPVELAGATFSVGSEATIGRDPGCTIQIEDTFISSVHARLFQRDGYCYLEDLDSRNGTLINGELVEATTLLKSRDQITVGATTMELR